MDYVPTTKQDEKIMLERIRVKSIDDLVDSFRPTLSNESLDLPPALTEMELMQHMKNISKGNKIMRYFVGGRLL